MRHALSPVIFGLMVTAAVAECPTTLADASHGVFVDFDGYVVRYDRRADGAVEELEFDSADGTGYRYISQHGILVLESWEMQFGALMDGTHEIITYDVPLPASISPNMTYASTTTVQYGSDAPFTEPLRIMAGAPQTQVIGNCTMNVLEVQMHTGAPGVEYVSNFIYFTALGFGVFVGGGDLGAPPDMYPATYIGTVPPTYGADGAPASVAPAAPAQATK
ncbi:MAG: hypothetical protein AAGF88_08315 [Pseudomonadota bacterium]